MASDKGEAFPFLLILPINRQPSKGKRSGMLGMNLKEVRIFLDSWNYEGFE